MIAGTFASIALGGLSICHQWQRAQVAEIYATAGEAKGYLGVGDGQR
jgi:hypothetical protein